MTLPVAVAERALGVAVAEGSADAAVAAWCGLWSVQRISVVSLVASTTHDVFRPVL